MEAQTPVASAVRRGNPKGYYALRVDAAGRVKLPPRFIEYIRSLGAGETLFVTQFDDVVKMFLPGAWERELAKVAAARPDRLQAFERAAEYLGGDVDLDPQGRVLIPQRIRETLGLVNHDVQLRMNNDTITVYAQETFDARIRPSVEGFADTLKSLSGECGLIVD